MKKSLLLLGALVAHVSSFAQTSPEISAWMSSHPDVYVMSSSNYNATSSDFREQLADKIIVYSGELTIEVLEAYDSDKSYNSADTHAGKDSDAMEIKTWLGLHQDVKIITRSQFDSMSAETQQMYANNGALILIGERITIQDIRNY